MCYQLFIGCKFVKNSIRFNSFLENEENSWIESCWRLFISHVSLDNLIHWKSFPDQQPNIPIQSFCVLFICCVFIDYLISSRPFFPKWGTYVYSSFLLTNHLLCVHWSYNQLEIFPSKSARYTNRILREKIFLSRLFLHHLTNITSCSEM